jgi:hypothetical protein
MKLMQCLLVVLACVACRRDEHSTTTTTSAAATGSTNESGNIRHTTATARISGARCDREDSCDPFGEGKRHASRYDCDHAEYGRAQAELKASDCPNGVDDTQLKRCLEALRNQDCEFLTAQLESIDPCRPAALCMHVP